MTVSTGLEARHRDGGATDHAWAVRERLAAAQTAIDRHPILMRDGRCITCGTGGGWSQRQEWTLGLPEEDTETLVDSSGGTPVRWVAGEGWLEGRE